VLTARKQAAIFEVAESLIFQVCDHPEVSCLNNPTTWPESEPEGSFPKVTDVDLVEE
jgi:hypothetical protein